MKAPRPLVLASMAGVSCLLLAGCPDSKLPQAPPKIPEPKAAAAEMHALNALATMASTPSASV